MADVWATAPIEVVVTVIKPSTPQGSTEQEKGKYPPEKELLKWGCKFGTNTHWSTVFTNNAPKEGDTVKVREYYKEENGEKKFVKWFLESEVESLKSGGAGGNRGAGAPQRNYDIENRQRAGDAAVAFKGDEKWDLHTTLTCADAFVEYYKSGKKPPKKTEA